MPRASGGLQRQRSRAPGSLWMTREDWARSWKPWLRGTLIGFPIGALPAGGSEMPTDPLLHFREAALATPEEFGTGRDRGCRRSRSRQQRLGRRRARPLLTLGLPTSATAAVMLAAFQQYGLQPGSAAVPEQRRPRLGPDREPLHRQCDAAGPQPAARRPLGAAALDPAALALRRHPRVRVPRDLHPKQQLVRPRHSLGNRASGLRLAGDRRSGCPRCARPHSRAHAGTAAPARARHQPGGPHHIRDEADVARAARARSRAHRRSHRSAVSPRTGSPA